MAGTVVSGLFYGKSHVLWHDMEGRRHDLPVASALLGASIAPIMFPSVVLAEWQGCERFVSMTIRPRAQVVAPAWHLDPAWISLYAR